MTLNGNKPRDRFVRTLRDACRLPQRRPDTPQGPLLCPRLQRQRQKKLWRPRGQTSCQNILLRWLSAGVSTERIYIKEQSATEEQRGVSPQTSTELCQTAAQRRTKAWLDSGAAKCPVKTFLRFCRPHSHFSHKKITETFFKNVLEDILHLSFHLGSDYFYQCFSFCLHDE